MATIMLTHQNVFDALSGSWQQAQTTPGSASLPHGKGVSLIEHWNCQQQSRLLAELSTISRQGSGWILMVNAPAPLSKQALQQAGVAPWRVLSIQGIPPGASQSLMERALAQGSMGALVSWQAKPGQRQQACLQAAAQRGNCRGFIITAPSGLPALH
ncbi:hypothetical protein [Zobellella maritima]|uniref:hypothetical protein n=1 Tax=Zobellella maritima TaxID=2059725 RepID=UPI000E3088AA|nr:hypothetical protein [Zobellella maritima]